MSTKCECSNERAERELFIAVTLHYISLVRRRVKDLILKGG